MKTLNTIDAIGAELDELYERVDTGDLTAEDSRELTMKLRILAQRADLLKNHVIEAKVEALKEAIAALALKAPHLRRVS